MTKIYFMRHKPQVTARVVANLGFVSELMDLEEAKRYAKLLRRVGNDKVRVVRYG